VREFGFLIVAIIYMLYVIVLLTLLIRSSLIDILQILCARREVDKKIYVLYGIRISWTLSFDIYWIQLPNMLLDGLPFQLDPTKTRPDYLAVWSGISQVTCQEYRTWCKANGESHSATNLHRTKKQVRLLIQNCD